MRPPFRIGKGKGKGKGALLSAKAHGVNLPMLDLIAATA